MGVFALPLAILSILSLAFAIERFLFWKHTLSIHDKIISLGRKNFSEFQYNSHRYDSIPLCRLMAALQSHPDSKINIVSPYFDTLMADCTSDMRKNHDSLSLIVALSPSFGLLGTVVGLMSSFQGLTVIGQGFESSVIANGVSQALTTTVAGLIISIMSSITLSISQQYSSRELSRIELFFVDNFYRPASNFS
jgi:biopolymer transport protein ExbB